MPGTSHLHYLATFICSYENMFLVINNNDQIKIAVPIQYIQNIYEKNRGIFL